MVAAIRTSFNTATPLKPAEQPGKVTAAVTPQFTDAAPTDRSHVQPVAQLYLQGDGPRGSIWVPGGIIQWAAIDRPMDGGDLTAELRVGALDGEKVLNADDTLGEHFGQILERLRGDRVVRIAVPNGSGGEEVLFEGYPLPATMQWTGDRQMLTAMCVSLGQEGLRTNAGQQVRGRYLRATPDAMWNPEAPDYRLITALPATFNPGGKPNRSAAALPMKTGRTTDGAATTQNIYLWTTDDYPTAKPWTFVQALRTLLYLWVVKANGPISVWAFLADTEELATMAPSPLAADPFIARITRVIDDVGFQSCNVEEAIAALCQAAGLHYEVALQTTPAMGRIGDAQVSYYLRVWASLEYAAQVSASPDKREMGLPTVHNLPRDKPFRDYTEHSPAASAGAPAAQPASLTIDPRDVSDACFLGGYQEFEGSFLLRPGWVPHPYLDDILTAEAEQASRDYWANEFEPEFSYDDNRLPTSVYHAAHPNHASYADVFRTWIFPDDPAYEGLSLGRKSTGNQPKWTSVKYKTHNAEQLWYTDPTWGAGFNAAAVATWVPRRRPFRETIGRKNEATTDTAPIVRIHFGMPAVKTLGNGTWVRIQQHRYLLGSTYYTVAPRDFQCSNNATCRLYADASAVVKESTTEWPSTAHVKLGTVTTSGGVISSIESKHATQVPAPNDPDWVEYTGDVKLDEQRAALHFDEVNIFNAPCFRENPDIDDPGDVGLAMLNYLKGHFWVQVTATVIGDQRMIREQGSASHATGTRRRHQMVDLGHERWAIKRRRDGNSFLNGLPQDSDPAYERRIDDELEFEYHAVIRNMQMAGATVAGNFETFYLDRRFKPGDAISGCAGLGLAFDRYPAIERVRYVNEGSGMRTVVTITDKRHNPELGAEG